MSNTTVKKVTKAQRNADIMAMLQKQPVKYGTTVEDAIAHLTHENALLSKKNSTTGKKKLTKAQEANEGYKKDILAFFQAHPNRLMTATEVMTEVLVVTYPSVTWTNQKAAALLNAISDKYDKESGELVSEGVLTRVEGKGKIKTTFQMKPDAIIEDDGEDTEDEAE